MNFCSSMVTFIKACMTFDEQSLEVEDKILELVNLKF